MCFSVWPNSFCEYFYPNDSTSKCIMRHPWRRTRCDPVPKMQMSHYPWPNSNDSFLKNVSNEHIYGLHTQWVWQFGIGCAKDGVGHVRQFIQCHAKIGSLIKMNQTGKGHNNGTTTHCIQQWYQFVAIIGQRTSGMHHWVMRTSQIQRHSSQFTRVAFGSQATMYIFSILYYIICAYPDHVGSDSCKIKIVGSIYPCKKQ